MKYTYEVKPELNVVVRIDKNNETASIPIDPANSDYQAYLRWLENPDAAQEAQANDLS